MSGHPLEQWRESVHGWRLPDRFRTAPPVRREATTVRSAEEAQAPPGSRSYARAVEVLPEGGTVLDVGCGAGGASLPLAAPADQTPLAAPADQMPPAARAGRIIGVDPEEHLLEALQISGGYLGVQIETITGRWPEVAPGVEIADLVVCHHVLYGVADLAPFAAALSAHARRRVVIEIPERHPLHALNPLWKRFHGLIRPDGPTAEDALAALTQTGLTPEMERWTDQGGWGAYPDLITLADRVRRRLHLPAERTAEVADTLGDLGADPVRPAFPGTAGRTLCTIWWNS